MPYTVKLVQIRGVSMRNRKTYLVEFSSGVDQIIYAYDTKELLSILKNFRIQQKLQWDSFMEINWNIK